MARLVADDLGVHRAGVDDRPIALRRAHVHLGDEGQGLVGLCIEVRLNPLPLGHHVGVRAQDLELLLERRLGPLLAHADRSERIDPVRRLVLKLQLSRLVEQHVDHYALRRRENHFIDELLVLDMPAVAADQLHSRPRQRNLEHPGVGGVGQVEADDLAELCGQGKIRLAAYQEHVAEPTHR